ncbi:LysM peptidoglycan-binding domain-containing protein [Niallia sp. XMNu-256]|uniref:LysM peptidoglycan-binding domain-containing protein n=1 Tax=Niallia sp. XMNu-256 TaxID=3082444 RepID=UPI0030D2B142
MSIVLKKNYIYTVKKGDTLYSIAQKFGSSVDAIRRANHLYSKIIDPNLIYPGIVLVVPSLSETGNVIYMVQSGDTVAEIASRCSTSVDLVAGINDLDNPNLIFLNQPLRLPAFVYEVQKGDSLALISKKFGIPISNISGANQKRLVYQLDLIWEGFHLIMPLPTSQNMVVWSPLPGTTMVDGQRLEGQARAFEANVLSLLRDNNGTVVSSERSIMADNGAPKYGNFTSTLPFNKTPTSDSGELWVYTRSAETGGIRDLIKTKVYF